MDARDEAPLGDLLIIARIIVAGDSWLDIDREMNHLVN